ncbi:hypothetical protein [Limnoglobus roseus]|uniref:Uncharacterized protein n=1 Tax=Limnoglobus roseus TaxID=2598579 RepID=A0A5C1AQJ9_9BACT|nr:hypothetical protein [Limnoglobus roseus]QEL20306.1 hypothetical protein PX52LOC_07398 [Limnoglobus roseus]
MIRFGLAVLFASLGSSAFAQNLLRFQWKAGEQLAFSVVQDTTISETAPLQTGGKPETLTTTTKLAIGKRWDVKDVDATGTATLTLTITAMKQEISKPLVGKDGKIALDTIVMDSATPDGAKEMAEYLNKPILTAKVDARGGVIEAKAVAGESTTNRLQAELPFRVQLPEQAVAVNGTWERTFNVKLDPPLGIGEAHEAKQTYTHRATNGGYAVIGLTTAFKSLPIAAAEQQPLIPWLWEGDVFVEIEKGRYAGAKLTAKKTIANHQGEGTKFVFESTYTEAAAGK